MPNRIVHFEIPIDNPERATAFYQKCFGWTFQKWEGPTEYWLVTTGPVDQPGINGGLLRRQPGMVTTNTVQVDNVDDAMATVLANGGTQTVPKMEIPGVGWVAYCLDTEGNMLGLFQPAPQGT
jgi:predicted enzyme related to lactoylglutathione lyase